MNDNAGTPKKQGRNNGAVVMMCLSFVFGMGAMSYAAVPLYRIFCQVTGYNGTTQRVDQVSSVVLDRTMRVTFDANVAPGLQWEFKPVQREVNPKIGETIQVNFTAENRSNETQRGQAVFNVTPGEAGVYFNKVQCFCFTETDLKPGEKLDMPVVFYIDPEIVKAVESKDIHTVTLSYTFYPKEGPKPVASNEGGAEKIEKKL
ncbi:cytochrome c oxidase assembly protein [Rhizobium ruizarguesonis]|jgi:cytochrome c oxidase assembly protein subunit 11|uniref:Cytochrome c oxidase assembly protein CtaG n=1 Tax=Rhizobium ruizarguesonis TaxID=2081791 RepID=A0ABY1X4V3_9HYPH|nr:cytochrome c oxidase assembly protein [Rhizobium ruizarguesonis]MBY5831972.1 cytochrome c oxidase assembly protein [Rhizobium leguminosarum]NKJ77528.1 cytochrome c oxidase assembly protein [Rhizobium leguminosarum bv. viciae]QIO44714.1 cytochrome c oxidase assembly protein [Rhizobium leguminosarum bv. trifolii]QJS26408.1 cytochrome c oxidase assembly protein [Rhizobium leguminosarum bv. trifolii TA1]MBY5860665.1 cytochrome c oxidase assembly protein [Rhizobium leguminosarum]